MTSPDTAAEPAGAASPRGPVIILDQPQMAENIGAAARVMANFGLDELRLVSPRDGWPQGRAWASASGADWVLDQAQVFESVAAAIADLNRVHAATARPRETMLPVLNGRQSSAVLHEAAVQGERVGLLFGAERAGLETMDIALCNAIVTLPVDMRHRSLNLAQAVAINAYEWRMTVDEAPPPIWRAQPPPVDKAAMIGLFEQLENELETAGFFFPPEKKGSMVRNLRVALSRAQFNDQETRTFRGVITALVRGRGRTMAKLAAKARDREDAPPTGDDATAQSDQE